MFTCEVGSSVSALWKRLLLMAFDFPRFAKGYKTLQRTEHRSEFYVRLYVAYKYCVLSLVWYLETDALSSEAKPFPLNPYFQRCWGPLAFCHLRWEWEFRVSTRREFWSRCGQSAPPSRDDSGPDAETVKHQSEKTGGYLLGFSDSFFFSLVQVEL